MRAHIFVSSWETGRYMSLQTETIIAFNEKFMSSTIVGKHTNRNSNHQELRKNSIDN